MRYDATLVNNGNVALRRLNITAPGLLLNGSCTDWPLDARLEVSATLQCAFHFLVEQDDIERGAFNNTFAAHALAPRGANHTSETVLSLATVTAPSSASLSAVIRTANCSAPKFAGAFFALSTLLITFFQDYSGQWARLRGIWVNRLPPEIVALLLCR